MCINNILYLKCEKKEKQEWNCRLLKNWNGNGRMIFLDFVIVLSAWFEILYSNEARAARGRAFVFSIRSLGNCFLASDLKAQICKNSCYCFLFLQLVISLLLLSHVLSKRRTISYPPHPGKINILIIFLIAKCTLF